ncbi:PLASMODESMATA CALLOSE-BINDING PROTEIN 3 [Striga hermonthica]|uniref:PLASMODESMATA CALLOSE-BINDING PROTEIN 3 n=1 Tax=Striga hermonthica TaxID=68872 RepID=A0A9N7RD49_STRHE|nr:PLASMODESMATA CALLOSE-BINDING PROTEIN 3 [Striga hermonthica]
MAALLVSLVLVLLLAMSGHSDATYCVCNSNLSQDVLQKNIDYACGAGADCTDIHQNGPCFNPNTVRDHCNFAVNSYYQRRNQVQGSCDFQGTATVTSTPPTTSTGSGCVYQASPSSGTSTGGTSTGGTNSGGALSGSLGPSGSGYDNNFGVTLSSQNSVFMMMLLVLWFLCLV